MALFYIKDTETYSFLGSCISTKTSPALGSRYMTYYSTHGASQRTKQIPLLSFFGRINQPAICLGQLLTAETASVILEKHADTFTIMDTANGLGKDMSNLQYLKLGTFLLMFSLID